MRSLRPRFHDPIPIKSDPAFAAADPPARRALFEQFRRLANVYFLVITILMLIGTYTTFFDSPLTPYTTLLPLCIVLAITMGKEGFEDLKRHAADRATNARPTAEVSLTDKGELEETCWKNVKVGRCVGGQELALHVSGCHRAEGGRRSRRKKVGLGAVGAERGQVVMVDSLSHVFQDRESE